MIALVLGRLQLLGVTIALLFGRAQLVLGGEGSRFGFFLEVLLGGRKVCPSWVTFGWSLRGGASTDLDAVVAGARDLRGGGVSAPAIRDSAAARAESAAARSSSACTARVRDRFRVAAFEDLAINERSACL